MPNVFGNASKDGVCCLLATVSTLRSLIDTASTTSASSRLSVRGTSSGSVARTLVSSSATTARVVRGENVVISVVVVRNNDCCGCRCGGGCRCGSGCRCGGGARYCQP